MVVLICGDRECNDVEVLKLAISKSGFKITKVLHGGARGADKLAEKWAKDNGIPFKEYTAKWDDINAANAVVKEKLNPWTKKIEKYNANAGFDRNSQMLEDAEAVIALQPNGITEGTKDTIKKAKSKGLPLYIQEKQDHEYEYQF